MKRIQGTILALSTATAVRQPTNKERGYWKSLVSAKAPLSQLLQALCAIRWHFLEPVCCGQMLSLRRVHPRTQFRLTQPTIFIECLKILCQRHPQGPRLLYCCDNLTTGISARGMAECNLCAMRYECCARLNIELIYITVHCHPIATPVNAVYSGTDRKFRGH